MPATDGVVKALKLEQPGKYQVSSTERMLKLLGRYQ